MCREGGSEEAGRKMRAPHEFQEQVAWERCRQPLEKGWAGRSQELQHSGRAPRMCEQSQEPWEGKQYCKGPEGALHR